MALSRPYRPVVIRYVNAQGKRVSKSTPGARRVRTKSKTFWGRVPDENGKVRPVSLCDDEEASERMLTDLKQRSKRIARGDVDPFEEHRKIPLTEHLDDFESGLLGKVATHKQAAQAMARCQKIIDACGFKRLADLSPSAVGNYLRERRQAGMSIQTSNHYLASIKSFANWLVKDRRMPSSPLTHLAKLNAKVDVRHSRRALTAAEPTRLIQATEQSSRSFRELDGSTRAMLYRLAVTSGLRASELASLSPASFDLTADPPTVTLATAYSKHRREDVLPLQLDFAERLRQWFRDRERSPNGSPDVLAFDRAADSRHERLFPGTWTEKGAKMLRADLEAAGIPYATDDGYADFHSLRHTFISNLTRGGVHPKLAQQLARHSSITLTMDRYSHVGLLDLNSALESLPTIATSAPPNAERPAQPTRPPRVQISVAPKVVLNQCNLTVFSHYQRLRTMPRPPMKKPLFHCEKRCKTRV